MMRHSRLHVVLQHDRYLVILEMQTDFGRMWATEQGDLTLSSWE